MLAKGRPTQWLCDGIAIFSMNWEQCHLPSSVAVELEGRNVECLVILQCLGSLFQNKKLKKNAGT